MLMFRVAILALAALARASPCYESNQTAPEQQTGPVLTHFLQGRGEFQVREVQLAEGFMAQKSIGVELRANLSDVAPIAPYIWAVWDADGVEADPLRHQKRLEHGFLDSTLLLRALHDEYREVEQQGVEGYPNTIQPAYGRHGSNDGSSSDVATCSSGGLNSVFFEKPGCSYSPVNAVLSFQRNGGDDSSFVLEISNLELKEDSFTLRGIVPQEVPLMGEGVAHMPFREQPHYHWAMDCSTAISRSNNVDNMRKSIQKKLEEEHAGNIGGVWMMMLKTK
jgi:hypothetical protein